MMKMSTKITETDNLESRQPINFFYLTKIWNCQLFNFFVNRRITSTIINAHVNTLTLAVGSIRELNVFQKIWQLIQKLIFVGLSFPFSVEQWATLNNYRTNKKEDFENVPPAMKSRVQFLNSPVRDFVPGIFVFSVLSWLSPLACHCYRRVRLRGCGGLAPYSTRHDSNEYFYCRLLKRGGIRLWVYLSYIERALSRITPQSLSCKWCRSHHEWIFKVTLRFW